jgi:hypothetical protein
MLAAPRPSRYSASMPLLSTRFGSVGHPYSHGRDLSHSRIHYGYCQRTGHPESNYYKNQKDMRIVRQRLLRDSCSLFDSLTEKDIVRLKCWNSPTDQSHETRRTHTETTFIAKRAYRTL